MDCRDLATFPFGFWLPVGNTVRGIKKMNGPEYSFPSSLLASHGLGVPAFLSQTTDRVQHYTLTAVISPVPGFLGQLDFGHSLLTMVKSFCCCQLTTLYYASLLSLNPAAAYPFITFSAVIPFDCVLCFC